MGDSSLNDVTNSSDNWISARSATKFQRGQSATVPTGSVTKRPVRCRNISIIALFAVVVLAVVVTIVVLVVLKKSSEDPVPTSLPPEGCELRQFGDVDIASPNGTGIGTTAWGECKPGFHGQAQPIKCQASGLWDSRPDCTPVDCGVAVWANADISQTGTTFGSTATATCRPGFDGGSRSVTCGADKQWTGGPTCIPVDCGEAVWENADISDQTGTAFGSTATATCMSGFDGGSQQVTCGADKLWTGGPTCIPVDCGAAVWENADISDQTGTTFGYTATATCRPGFDGGSQTVTCGADKLWTGGPTCEPVVNGGWTEWSQWSTCSVTCDIGSRARNRTCTNPEPANGGADCVGKEEDEEAESCDSGTICQDDHCGEAEWENADISNQTGTTFGSWATATCRTGFDGGSQTITCDADKQWTGGPTCRLVVNGGWTEWSQWSTCSVVTCGVGSRARTRTCINPAPANGGADCVGKEGEDESCDSGSCIDNCGAAVWENADISDQTGTTVGSTAKATCMPGFDGGSQTVTCGADKQWTGGPNCRLVGMKLRPTNPLVAIGTSLTITCEASEATTGGLTLQLQTTEGGVTHLATSAGNMLMNSLLVSCSHDGILVCMQTDGGGQASTTLSVYRDPETPVLTLPLTLIVDSATGSNCIGCEKEQLRCRGTLGYPNGNQLVLETDESGTWEPLQLGTKETVDDVSEACNTDRTVFFYSVKFSVEYNATQLRCAVKHSWGEYTGHASEPVPLYLVSNTICDAWNTTADGSDVFIQHPFLCTASVWCASNRIFVNDCSPNCPVIIDMKLSHCGPCSMCTT